MINPISSATQSQPTAQAKAAPSTTVQPKAQPAISDTVQISAAAQARQETIETPVQTAKEAAAGDLQAKHLLAREAAQKAKG
jgi:anti-sigma28 factor (negative regulator of flagellin synthesis)